MIEKKNAIITLQDIHLVAFLVYHDIPYEMKKTGNRISFVIDHPRTDAVIGKFHGSNGQLFAGKYVEILKTVRREMYIRKGE